ncbi:type II secretion system minor pseudopilin GspI [Thauera sp.]|uniref:type II secretion system minor pseudopilin GspI n=1 Tax=Thauera sp. TaxID=1905334 RepID=UPI00257C4677|nr:type II secretion system minor pseudopilin GspI [Thauera sp.]
MNPATRGFSLLENLIALAIIAVALSAAVRAGTQATDTSDALAQGTLARWVAQNRLAELRVRPVPPPLGRSDGEALQGRYRFRWEQTVTATAVPAWRAIDIVVRDAGGHPRAHLAGHVLVQP